MKANDASNRLSCPLDRLSLLRLEDSAQISGGSQDAITQLSINMSQSAQRGFRNLQLRISNERDGSRCVASLPVPLTSCSLSPLVSLGHTLICFLFLSSLSSRSAYRFSRFPRPRSLLAPSRQPLSLPGSSLVTAQPSSQNLSSSLASPPSSAYLPTTTHPPTPPQPFKPNIPTLAMSSTTTLDTILSSARSSLSLSRSSTRSSTQSSTTTQSAYFPQTSSSSAQTHRPTIITLLVLTPDAPLPLRRAEPKRKDTPVWRNPRESLARGGEGALRVGGWVGVGGE